ncbi:MAG: ATP-binding protein [Opitutus sp.]|nr:ATP-binding protein [Opitutus sp.]
MANPWPGLESYTESSRRLFFGREKETEELVRLIRRNTLTVLFGQSGLGKSSLLQAGAFPNLRDADFLPLYLRLDHAPDSPPLADQVKSALTAAFASAGADAPAFRSSETLWEYFHRKDIDIWSAKNRLLTPVLAFDQFEEIFTLGRATDAQRERGRAFLIELADLVENRAPAELRAKFDSGELDITRFNFEKPSCQIVLSLREDFLPDLESLKNEMRSIMQSASPTSVVNLISFHSDFGRRCSVGAATSFQNMAKKALAKKGIRWGLVSQREYHERINVPPVSSLFCQLSFLRAQSFQTTNPPPAGRPQSLPAGGGTPRHKEYRGGRDISSSLRSLYYKVRISCFAARICKRRSRRINR